MRHSVIRVSLEDFLRTGVLGAVRFGLTSDEITDLLGPPDMVWRRRRQRQPLGLAYGDVELYFDNTKDNRLYGIYLDEFTVPRGSEFLKLDAWCLRGAMSQEEAETALTAAGIGFQIVALLDPTMIGLSTTSNAILGFIREAATFSPPAGLYNISREVVLESA